MDDNAFVKLVLGFIQKHGDTHEHEQAGRLLAEVVLHERQRANFEARSHAEVGDNAEVSVHDAGRGEPYRVNEGPGAGDPVPEEEPTA